MKNHNDRAIGGFDTRNFESVPSIRCRPAWTARRWLSTFIATICTLLIALPACAQDAPGLLVNADWLAAHIEDTNLVLLHVGDADGYDVEHIAGARRVTPSDVAAPRSSDRTAAALEMPEPEVLRATLQSMGVSDGSRIVLYAAGGDITAATRVLFTLRHFGLADRTHLLDGGLSAWKAAGHAVTSIAPAARPGQLSPLVAGDLVVDETFVNERRTSPGYSVVDARATVFYDGTRQGGSRPGHIAGAVSVPFSEITNAEGHVRSRAQLEALFRAAGVQPGDTVIAYCHIGQQATGALLGAALIGHPVLLYDGSYNQWSQRDDLPVDNPRGGGDR